MLPSDRQGSLTPGGVVFLAADRFGQPTAGRDKGHWLPKHAYAAAFLAAEQSGVLRLNVRAKKALMGLRSVEAVYADPAGGASVFPDDSLEAFLHKEAVSLAKKNKHEVRNIVAGLLPSASADPWNAALRRIQDALGARGLLTATTKKVLGIIKVSEYSTPEQTAAMAEERVVEVQELLEACQAARPDLWKRLLDEIDSGIRSREQEISTTELD
jgi:hypothetical protein